MSSVPAADQADPPTPFEALGGEDGVRRLVDAFYDIMDADADVAGVRRMHGPDLTLIRERLSDWLNGWMGGPPVFAQRHPGRPCIMAAHSPFSIGAAEAEQWMTCMRRAMARAEVPLEWREPLDRAFARMCEGLQNVAS